MVPVWEIWRTLWLNQCRALTTPRYPTSPEVLVSSGGGGGGGCGDDDGGGVCGGGGGGDGERLVF